MSSVCEDQKQHERRIPKVHRGIKRRQGDPRNLRGRRSADSRVPREEEEEEEEMLICDRAESSHKEIRAKGE